MKNKIKYVIGGMLLTVIIGQLLTPAMATLAAKSIQVFTGVNIYIDDVKLNPKDAQGNPVEVFIYNGTTYLPVRAVSEALRKPVQWEGNTSSVYVGKHESSKAATLFHELDYFVRESDDDMTYKVTEKDNLGNMRQNVVIGRIGRTIKTNGQYRSISGTFFQRYDYRHITDDEVQLEIYGDGKLLYVSTMKGGMEPVEFKVDISGVLELKVVHGFPNGWYNFTYSGISGFGLYT